MTDGFDERARATNVVAGTKGFTSVPLSLRFFDKVIKPEDPHACWLWTGSAVNGYGDIWVDGKKRRATQVSWSLFHNLPFPDGMEACHSCDNPPCVNPKHIWVGTHQQNMADSKSKGRHKFNEVGFENKWKAQRLMTHCHRGHEFTEKNTRRNTAGHRLCAACVKITAARSTETRKKQRAEQKRSASIIKTLTEALEEIKKGHLPWKSINLASDALAQVTSSQLAKPQSSGNGVNET